MKFAIAAAFAIVAAVGVIMWSQSRPEDPKVAWKRTAVEPETKERPARFEAMKFTGTEVRLPASDKKK